MPSLREARVSDWNQSNQKIKWLHVSDITKKFGCCGGGIIVKTIFQTKKWLFNFEKLTCHETCLRVSDHEFDSSSSLNGSKWYSNHLGLIKIRWILQKLHHLQFKFIVKKSSASKMIISCRTALILKPRVSKALTSCFDALERSVLSSGTSLFIWPFHSTHNFPCRFYVKIYEYQPKYDHFWSTSPLNYLKPIRLCFCDELFYQWVGLTDGGYFCTIWCICKSENNVALTVFHAKKDQINKVNVQTNWFMISLWLGLRGLLN